MKSVVFVIVGLILVSSLSCRKTRTRVQTPNAPERFQEDPLDPNIHSNDQRPENYVEPIQVDGATGISISVSTEPAPSFVIRDVELMGIDFDGRGKFRLTVECTQVLETLGEQFACDGIPFSKLTYKLIEDDYPDNLTIEEADDLFHEGASYISKPIEPVPQAFHGGFMAHLKGPQEMALNSAMIFIIQGNQRSYTYFNIDVKPLDN